MSRAVTVTEPVAPAVSEAGVPVRLSWVAAAGETVNEPELAVVRVAGSVGVVAQSQMLGEPGHGRVRMLIVHRVDKISRGGPDGGQGLLRPRIRVRVVIIGFVGVW